MILHHVENICGVRVPFYLFEIGEPMPISAPYDPIGTAGFYNPEKGEVYIRNNENSDCLQDVITHERVHVFLDQSGLGHWLQNVATGKRRKESFEELEEELVRLVTPHLRGLG